MGATYAPIAYLLLFTASFNALPDLNTGTFDLGILITSSGFLGFLPSLAFLF